MVIDHLEFYKKINLYFDRVYVVTIPRLTDRQAHMRILLDGLEFEFVNGMDKEELPANTESLYNRELHRTLSRLSRPMRTGEIACAMSHLQVYRKIIENGFERVLILEDDVELEEQYLHEVPNFFQHLPEPWDIAYLGYWKNEKKGAYSWVKQCFYILMRVLGLHKWSIRRIMNTYPRPVNKFVNESGNHEGAYAYAVTLAGCKKLLAFNEPIRLNADNLFSHLITNKFINGYASVHPFFRPVSGETKGRFGSETGR